MQVFDIFTKPMKPIYNELGLLQIAWCIP